jgi:dihydroneopterin aldolase / 2-amino-4-hydroxy-6-hydroxymethyldihydropteridine diphosphokinase
MNGGNDALVFLSLGANIGDREVALREAVSRIRAFPHTRIDRISSVYETEPWGYHEQDPFLNCVVSARTQLTAEDFFRSLKNAERDMGRAPGERYHPRLIDIDILFFQNEIIETDELTVPHVSIGERRFVLEPFCEIAGEFMHPVLNKTMLDLLSECRDTGRIRRTDIMLIVQADPC